MNSHQLGRHVLAAVLVSSATVVATVSLGVRVAAANPVAAAPTLPANAICYPADAGGVTYIICRDQSGNVTSVTPVTAPGPGTGGPGPDPSTLVYVPYLVGGMPDGSLCIAVRVITTPGGPNSPIANQAEQTWLRLAPRYPFCPGGPPPGPSVTAYAESFIRTIALPVPNPRVAPGYGITGKTGYLETGSTLYPPAVIQPTPFGPLHVVMTAQYFVHWGDESDPTAFSGPFVVEGAPWPKGSIAHTWTNVGAYDIVVQMRWTASWFLGPDQGILTGLTTTAGIPAFAVQQLQAVID
jgi:hypothetical protein